MGDQTLPYRTTGDDIERVASALARGRDLEQIRSLFSSSNNFRGTVSAAEELGFFDTETGELTSTGETLALGDQHQKRRVLFDAVLEYGPYELLLEAISAEGIEGEEGDEFTSLEWIEKWWNTNGYGSSQTNRTEGSSAFAKIVEYLEIGEYKQGRRGHPSRIEWAGDAQKRINEARHEKTREKIGVESSDLQDDQASDMTDDHDVAGKDSKSVPRPRNNVLTLNLGNERVAELSLPPRLTPHEKRRLVALVELMITTDEQADEESQLEMGFGKEKSPDR